jgi:hypothetical protein
MLQVSSTAFEPDGSIPSKYTCDGYGVSPPLEWSKVPEDTQSVAILVDDRDSGARPFLHWLVTDLPPTLRHLEEGSALPRDARVGESDAGTASYYGPCPSSGLHHYRFHVYALDMVIGRRPENRDDFLRAIEGHVLDDGELVGAYTRAHA